MTDIPRAHEPDSTLAFLREGYEFTSNRCRALGTDIFRARLMLSPLFCMLGAEAAEVFYSPDRFTRHSAMPLTTVKLLQDFGSVQTLGGAEHRHRKAMFLGIMRDASIARMVEIAEQEWRAAAASWGPGPVVLLDEAATVLCRAALRWAGLDPSREDAEERTRDYVAMVAGAGDHGVGPWVRGEVLRTRNERWARGVVARVRAGELAPDPGAPARVIAEHRAPDGEPIPEKAAAVELINVFRPVVAIAWFIVHAALAMHRHAQWRERLRTADGAELERFVQEVRRLAPFFPVIGGRVREPFDWRGESFAEGTWMVLDLYGTNRDPRNWENPDSFRPERFRDWSGSACDFVPQGGGPHLEGHRCPGEWITIALMKQTVRFLARDLDYAVPEQDLRVDLSRIPAAPASRFVITPRAVPAAA